MTTKQGDLVGKLAALVEGDDGKGAAAAGVPIDGEIFGVGLVFKLIKAPGAQERHQWGGEGCGGQ